ncbi:MAG: septum formation initiator family protein [Candidatus Kuenenbacteria bacterium]
MLVLFLLLIFVGRAIIKEKQGQRETIGTISALQAEINQLEGKNFELASMIKYLRSNDFIEREARGKLNMQKEGESVIIIPQAKEGLVAGASAGDRNMPNYLRWWRYFFE